MGKKSGQEVAGLLFIGLVVLALGAFLNMGVAYVLGEAWDAWGFWPAYGVAFVITGVTSLVTSWGSKS